MATFKVGNGSGYVVIKVLVTVDDPQDSYGQRVGQIIEAQSHPRAVLIRDNLGRERWYLPGFIVTDREVK